MAAELLSVPVARHFVPHGQRPQRAGYVSFLFFRSKAWWVPLAKQLLRCALWVVGVTQRLPLVRVCEPAQNWTATVESHSDTTCTSMLANSAISHLLPARSPCMSWWTYEARHAR